MNNIQASKKCAIFVPPHEIKWIGVISRKPMQSFVFHATFKMCGNISQTVVKCHNLICKHHLGSCSSFQSSMCWVGSTSESYKTKKQRCFLFAVCYFLSILNNPHNLILVQTFRNKFQTSEIVTYVYQYWTMLANFI